LRQGSRAGEPPMHELALIQSVVETIVERTVAPG
jgi:hypothetical protein